MTYHAGSMIQTDINHTDHAFVVLKTNTTLWCQTHGTVVYFYNIYMSVIAASRSFYLMLSNCRCEFTCISSLISHRLIMIFCQNSIAIPTHHYSTDSIEIHEMSYELRLLNHGIHPSGYSKAANGHFVHNPNTEVFWYEGKLIQYGRNYGDVNAKCRKDGVRNVGDASSGMAWWRHQMETFSASQAICAGNSPVTGECPAQRPVTRTFDFFLWSATE